MRGLPNPPNGTFYVLIFPITKERFGLKTFFAYHPSLLCGRVPQREPLVLTLTLEASRTVKLIFFHWFFLIFLLAVCLRKLTQAFIWRRRRRTKIQFPFLLPPSTSKAFNEDNKMLLLPNSNCMFFQVLSSFTKNTHFLSIEDCSQGLGWTLLDRFFWLKNCFVLVLSFFIDNNNNNNDNINNTYSKYGILKSSNMCQSNVLLRILFLLTIKNKRNLLFFTKKKNF